MASAFAVSLWTLAWVARRKSGIASHAWWALMVGYGVLISCAVHDAMLVTGPIAPTGPTYLFWGFTVLLVAFALISGEYIVTTLGRAERSNQELEQRVHQKSAELEQSYAHLRQAEIAGARDSARTQERTRLMRDMHDGMGAQLMTALRGVERGTLSSDQVAHSLQDGLDELRLLMDSSDQSQPLQVALANWRNRWDARLTATGLLLVWQLDDSLETLDLPGDKVLQLMRILQEATTNIVKHARATQARVHAQVSLDAGRRRVLQLDIDDNGQGFASTGPGQANPSGRGLRNMQQRAHAVGARLHVGPRVDGVAGASVRIELALDAA
jgi:signal transduction histidine kinase